MKILSYSNKDYMHLNLAEEAQLLLKDPVIYFNKKEIFTTLWEFPKDLKRHVLFSPYSVLIMKAPKRFRVKLFNSQLIMSIETRKLQICNVTIPFSDIAE